MPKDPVFGLVNRGAYLSLFQDEEEKIFCLRKIANELEPKIKLQGYQVFIRYKHTYPNRSTWVYEYTTALPWPRKPLKRKLCGSNEASQGHTRWLYAGGNFKKVEDPRYHSRLAEKLIDFNNPTNPFGFRDRTGYGSVPSDFYHWHQLRESPIIHQNRSDRYSLPKRRSVPSVEVLKTGKRTMNPKKRWFLNAMISLSKILQQIKWAFSGTVPDCVTIIQDHGTSACTVTWIQQLCLLYKLWNFWLMPLSILKRKFIISVRFLSQKN